MNLDLQLDGLTAGLAGDCLPEKISKFSERKEVIRMSATISHPKH